MIESCRKLYLGGMVEWSGICSHGHLSYEALA